MSVISNRNFFDCTSLRVELILYSRLEQPNMWDDEKSSEYILGPSNTHQTDQNLRCPHEEPMSP